MSFDPNDFTVLAPSTVSKVMRPSHTLLNKKQRKRIQSLHERDTTYKGGDGYWVSIAVHVMDAAIATVLQPGALRWYGLTQEARSEGAAFVMYGWRTMR
ncbi:hypothetical protein TNCV_1878131 [Trichonephila clavipes]|nr:hypothetical protein TNCV_1878131 [Trichonephila clavipes]